MWRPVGLDTLDAVGAVFSDTDADTGNSHWPPGWAHSSSDPSC